MRKRFKIPLVGIIFIAVIILTTVVVIYKSHFLENWANRYLAGKFAKQYNLEINIAEIDGSFVTGFSLRNVLIELHEDSIVTPIAFVPHLSIKYDFSNLWNRRFMIDSLLLNRPIFYFNKDSAGHWSIPAIQKQSGENGSNIPSWEIGFVKITDAEIELSIPDKTYHWIDVNLAASIRSEEGTTTLKIDSLRLNNEDRRLVVKSASGLATVFEDRLAIQNFAIISDSSRADFSLIYDKSDGNFMNLTLDDSHINVKDIASLFGAKIKGNLDITGTLFHQMGNTGGDLFLTGLFIGKQFDSLHARLQYNDKILHVDTLYGSIFGGCSINGFGNINLGISPRSYHLEAQIDSFNLKNLVPNSFTSNLNGRLIMDGRGFKPEYMIIDADLELEESYFDRYHFHNAIGQMSITMKGLYFFPGFRFRYHENLFWCEGEVGYKDNIYINARSKFGDLSDFAHQTFIDLPAGRGEADFSFTGPTKDPALTGQFKSDSVWFYGYYSNDFTADFDIESFIYGRRGPVKVISKNGNAWAFPYDSIYAEMRIDSTILILDTVSVVNEISETSTNGFLDFESYPKVLTLERLNPSISKRDFISNENQIIQIDSNGFIFEKVNLRSIEGNISIDGRANYDETLDLSWDIRNIAIAPWVKLFTDSLDMAGELSSEGNISGAFINPRFQLSANLDWLQYRGLILGNLQSYLSYEDTTLFIDSAYLESAEGLYTAEGDFPINLTLSSGHDLFDERHQNISLQASDKRLDLAAFVLNSVEYITGNFEADINLTGQPLHPHLNGTCTLDSGIVKLIDLQDRLEDVRVELEMSDQLIKIVTVSASIPNEKNKNPGEITIKEGGTILVNSINSFTYTLDLNCSNVPLNYELGEFTGLADAELLIRGSSPPKVMTDTTNILLYSAVYAESFEEETGFSILNAIEADNTWDLDLMVEMPSNFWIKNDDIDAELSGDLNIVREAGIYNFLGTLEVIRGKFYLYDKTYRMVPGGQIIYDNIEALNPKLDFEIITHIRTQPRYTGFENEESYSYELRLHVGGTLENPIFSPSGDAQISSENILPSILANADVQGQDADNSISDRITIGGFGLLANQMSRIGTRSLGVETFEINPDFRGGFNPSGTQITIGTYMFPNLYVSGSSYFDVNRGQEVGVEYRLGRNTLLEGRRDESNLYHFTFKIRWEYGAKSDD